MSAVKLSFCVQSPVTSKVAHIPIKRIEKYLMFTMMKGWSVLHCVCLQKNLGGAMATPANCRVGNPPHDLFIVYEIWR